MATIEIDKIAQDTVNAISDRVKSLNHLNIIVAGKTGVGKSTLVNAVFRAKLAETGMGRPVTAHIRKITKRGIPLSIYDTKGFELEESVQQAVKEEIFDTINEGAASKDINQMIHCIWYCINTASNRIEPKEIEWIRELSQSNQVTRVPIIVVLTQSFSQKKAQQMRKTLENENLDIAQIIPVLAEDYEIEGLGVAQSYGLDVLVKVMAEALPEELLETFQHVQIGSLEEKKRHARGIIKTAVLSATGEGAVPIPFSDAALLIPTQMTMIAGITVVFGIDVNKGIITALLSSTLGTGGATVLGKTVVSNLLKLIPGAGSVVGGVISAATAGVITAALGEAYISVMEMVYNGEMKAEDINSAKGKEIMSSMFKKYLKK